MYADDCVDISIALTSLQNRCYNNYTCSEEVAAFDILPQDICTLYLTSDHVYSYQYVYPGLLTYYGPGCNPNNLLGNDTSTTCQSLDTSAARRALSQDLVEESSGASSSSVSYGYGDDLVVFVGFSSQIQWQKAAPPSG